MKHLSTFSKWPLFFKTSHLIKWPLFFSQFILLFIYSFAHGQDNGKITWPNEDNLIFQRETAFSSNNRNYGPVEVYGYFTQPVTEIKVSFVKVQVPNNDIAEERLNMNLAPENNFAWTGINAREIGYVWPLMKPATASGKVNFCSTYRIKAGYYEIQVKGYLNGNWISLPPRRVGVGDVYVIAGQSNAAGDLDVGQLSSDFTTNGNGMIQFYNRKISFDGNDPGSPNRGGESTKQFPWYWRRLGSLLLEAQKVPVAFFQTAWSGTTVRNWKETINGQTTYNYGINPPPAYPAGQPFGNLKHALQEYVGLVGLKAILWMQGEADSQTLASTYSNDLQAVIGGARQTYNMYNHVPWMISLTSYVNGNSYAQVRQGQTQAIQSNGLNFQGPNSDEVVGSYYRTTNAPFNNLTHFNVNGLYEIAQRWNNAIAGNGAFLGTFAVLSYPPTQSEFTSNGRLSAEFVQNASASSFSWYNQSTGETVNGTKVINNPSTGIWSARFNYSSGQAGKLAEFYVDGVNNPSGPCDLSQPKSIGTWNGYNVELRQLGGYKALVTVVQSNGITKYFPRGKNYWTSISRNGGTDNLYNCINTTETGWGGLAFPGEVTLPAGYSEGYESDGARYFYIGNQPVDPVDPCNLSQPKSIGTWNGHNVELRQLGSYKALVTVVVSNGITKYFPRGKNYWSSVSRNGGTDNLYNCINTTETGWGGLAFPSEVTLPAGYSEGYESDGARYFYIGNQPVDPCDLSQPKSIGTWNGYNIELRQLGGYKALVTVVPSNGIIKYFPRGKNFWSSVSRNGGTDNLYNCINTSETGWGGLGFPGEVSLPAGYSEGYEADGARYFYRTNGGRIGASKEITSTDVSIKIKGYPNPVRNKMQVDVYLESNGTFEMSLFNSEGKSILKNRIKGFQGLNTTEIDFKQQPNGIYYLNVQADQQNHTLKVVKIND